MKATEILPSMRALLMDIDGTLTHGSTMLPGMLELFEFLHSRQIKFMVATNNSSKSPAKYQQLFSGFGAKIGLENIITCSDVTAWYLNEHYPSGCKAYVIGQEGILNALKQTACELLPDGKGKADVVVVGFDNQLSYEKLKNAILYIQQGALFIGTNPDLLNPTEEGLVPECGTTLAALEAATGIKPLVMGKPRHYLFDMALQRMGSQPAETAMLGDRLETDILGAASAGLKTILISTGIDDAGSVKEKGITPDVIVEDLPDLLERWKQA